MGIQLRNNRQKRKLTQLGGDELPNIQGSDPYEDNRPLQGNRGTSILKLHPQSPVANQRVLNQSGGKQDGSLLQGGNPPTSAHGIDLEDSAYDRYAEEPGKPKLVNRRKPGLKKIMPRVYKSYNKATKI